jgi:hypothetical protein
MQRQHIIEIPCKYYIGVFLENNCGSPADLTFFPDLYERLRSLLTKQPEKYPILSKIYEPNTVKVYIPDDWIDVYGLFINRNNILKFNAQVEQKLKNKLYQYMRFRCSIGYSVASGIREFQDEFCMSEEVWPFESIKKELDRNANLNEYRFSLSLENRDKI